MKIFVSGASGLVGGNCLSYFKTLGWVAVGTHRTFPTADTVFFDTLSLADPANFSLLSFAPDVIIHCGALTHVDYCETHEAESFEKNVKATTNLIEIAKACKAKFVFLSTDYVFDGKQGPYLENAPVNPLNIYGKHKLAVEQFIQKELSQYLVIRVTNVYGKEIRSKNFVSRILEQCKKGEKIVLKLPYDQFANPTNAWDIARAIGMLLEGEKNGIYHICGTDYMNRVNLAQKVLKYFPKIAFELYPQSTNILQQTAKRPLLGGFVPAKFLSEFPDFLFSSLDEYLNG